VFGISRPKIDIGSQGSVLVGGKTGISLEKLYGSPTVVVWFQGIYVGRAKIAKGSEFIWVRCSCEIAAGSVGIFGGQAKVCTGCVMLVGSRKITYRYVMIGVGCSVDHYGLFSIQNIRSGFTYYQQTYHILPQFYIF
jgi:hypothetical protein